MNERTRLQQIAHESRYSEGIHRHVIAYSFEIAERFMTSGATLELGSAEGEMTDRLVSMDWPVTVVEGASVFCDQIRNRHRGCAHLRVINSLFEEYRPDGKFKNIILGHVLEHVEDPVATLARIRNWLTDDGIIFAVVPNAYSIHRQLGVTMGLLQSEHDLNAMDRHHGHRRVYDPESLRQEFRNARLEVRAFGGFFFKPFSNAQLEDWVSDDAIVGMMALGEQYPDIAAEIYVVASAGSGIRGGRRRDDGPGKDARPRE